MRREADPRSMAGKAPRPERHVPVVVVGGFPGWERAGVMGANALFSLLTRYRALAARRMVVLGSGSLGLRTATLALEHGVDVAAIVEVAPRVCGDAQLACALQARGVPILSSHTVREARGPVGEVHSVDRKSTRLNSSHRCISYAVFCLKKKKRRR